MKAVIFDLDDTLLHDDLTISDYTVRREEGETLEDYLDNKVFAGMKQITLQPDPETEAGFDRYMQRFTQCLHAQKAAGEFRKS